MSHIVTVQAKLLDKQILGTALRELKLPPAVLGAHTIYNDEVNGLGIQLPDWNYPVVIDERTGDIRYDNYNGNWGKQIELDRLVQGYTRAKSESELLAMGYGDCTQETLQDGTVRLVATSY